MYYNSVYVKIIKLSVCDIESTGISGKKSLLESVVWLREKYEMTLEKKYLEKAIWHIYAFLELGYPYEAGEDEFRKVLGYLDLREEKLFSPEKYSYKKIPVTKANIRRLLGRWNPKLHCMKIEEAVKDIMSKTKKKECGVYLYHSGKILMQDGETTLWERTYKLYVQESETIFHDINKNRYFLFI